MFNSLSSNSCAWERERIARGRGRLATHCRHLGARCWKRSHVELFVTYSSVFEWSTLRVVYMR
eukprot:701224-Lingulodinium_polyedra.AAC.1